jgi:hypothetical protein
MKENIAASTAAIPASHTHRLDGRCPSGMSISASGRNKHSAHSQLPFVTVARTRHGAACQPIRTHVSEIASLAGPIAMGQLSKQLMQTATLILFGMIHPATLAAGGLAVRITVSTMAVLLTTKRSTNRSQLAGRHPAHDHQCRRHRRGREQGHGGRASDPAGHEHADHPPLEDPRLSSGAPPCGP